MSGFSTPSGSNLPLPPPRSPNSRGGMRLAFILAGLTAIVVVAWIWLHSTGDPAVSDPPHVNPDSPAATPVLTVETTPPGAVVILDDRIIGTAPIAAFPLPPGRHSLRCEREGYAPSVQAFEPAAGNNRLAIVLTPVSFAELVVASTPAGAEILIDGEFQGRTPATLQKLSPGLHEVVIRKENFTTYQGRLELHPGEKKQFTGIVLNDKLILMLRELLATDPRSIGAHLDLAHYYYVNNRMAEAAQTYVRANQLAGLPVEILPDDATQAEREQLLLTNEWDKARVKKELDKHIKSYRQYFGGDLDFEGFQKAYKEKSNEPWDIRNFNWVMEEAERRFAADQPGRCVELFGDARVLNPGSITALAGLARAEIAHENLREGLALAQKATTLLAGAEISKGGQQLAGRAWRYLAAAFVQAATQSPSADQAGLMQQAEAAMKAAAAILGGEKKDDYERAWLLYLRAELAGVQGQLPARLEGLAAAYGVARKNREADSAAAELCRTQVEFFAMELAWARFHGGKTAEATAVWKELVQMAEKNGAVQKRAQAILDDLAQDRMPVKKHP